MADDLNTVTIPDSTGPNDRSESLRAHAWASVVMSVLCAAFATRVFFIMLAPTHSFAVAFDLWRHDKGALASVTAMFILTFGGLLTFARLRPAESWAQLTRTDRALSVIGIIPASLLYYPIIVAATAIGLMLCFCILVWANFARRIEGFVRRKPRVRTR